MAEQTVMVPANSAAAMLRQAAMLVDGSRKFASDALGVSPRTLRYKIARLRELGYEIPR